MTTPRLLPSFLLCVTLGLLLSPASSGPQGAGPGIRAVPGQTSTVLPDGRWLLLGGQGPQGSTRTAEIYDPRTGITTALTPLRPARAWHSATVLPDGTVLVFGGAGSNDPALAEPQIFDPGTGTFQSLSIQGITPRAHHSATLLTDGRVLIAGGGEASGQALALTEVWTPQTGALDTISAPMSARRSGHTATLLGDGTVLLWGGTAAETASGEVFDPVTANFSRIAGMPWGSLSSDPPQLAASLPAAGHCRSGE